jgi:glycosyltransferase involved in cell wall biosynthesis
MEIIIAHPADPIATGAGGAVRWAIHAATSLSKLGHKVTLLGWQGQKNPGSDPLPFAFLPVFTGPYNWKKYVLELFGKLPFFKIGKQAIILTHRFDVMAAFVLWKPANPKILVSTGPLYAAKSLWPRLFPLIEKAYRLAEKLVLPRLDLIGIMDQVTYQRYANMDFIPKEMLQWTWTAVDSDVFKPYPEVIHSRYQPLASTGKISIAFAGRLDKVKNVDFLLRAYAILEKSQKNIELIIIGNGPEKGNLENLAHSLQLENIKFAGEVPALDMPAAMQAIDIIVLPAMGGEGSPTILKEALACGIPVVSMKVGDVEKFIQHPLAGRLVQEMDERIFARAITEVMASIANYREEVTKACCAIAADFSIVKFGQHWQDLAGEAQAARQSRRVR